MTTQTHLSVDGCSVVSNRGLEHVVHGVWVVEPGRYDLVCERGWEAVGELEAVDGVSGDRRRQRQAGEVGGFERAAEVACGDAVGEADGEVVSLAGAAPQAGDGVGEPHVGEQPGERPAGNRAALGADDDGALVVDPVEALAEVPEPLAGALAERRGR
jgi:hypothetical protein